MHQLIEPVFAVLQRLFSFQEKLPVALACCIIEVSVSIRADDLDVDIDSYIYFFLNQIHFNIKKIKIHSRKKKPIKMVRPWLKHAAC